MNRVDRKEGEGVVEVVRVQCSGTTRVLNQSWMEVNLRIRLWEEGPWLRLTPKGGGLLIARRFSGSQRDKEAPELSVISALKLYLGQQGVSVTDMKGIESQQLDEVTDYRYWVHLGARLSVAIQPHSQGVVQVVGLS